jgi:hypothetical protein
MESSRAAQAEKEYSAQHFGFDPTWLVDGFAEDSLRHVTETLGKLKNEIHFIAHFFKTAVLRIHMFLGLQDPDPLVRGMDPDPDPALNPDPDPSIIMQK